MKPRHFWYLYEAEKTANDQATGPQPGKLSKHEIARLKRVAGIE